MVFARSLFVCLLKINDLPAACGRGKRPRGLRRAAVTETLENRLVFATAGGVENVLLPEFIAQMGNPNNQLPASDAWWALRSQRNMAIDEPITKVMNFGAHNAYNALNEGFRIARASRPEPDPVAHRAARRRRTADRARHPRPPRVLTRFRRRPQRLILKHGPGRFLSSRPARPRTKSSSALGEIARLAGAARERQRGHLPRHRGRDRAVRERGRRPVAPEAPEPPRLDDLHARRAGRRRARGRRGASWSRAASASIIFTHRNDDRNGRFGAPSEHADPNGHVWYGTGLAFRANGGDDPVVRPRELQPAQVDDSPRCRRRTRTLLRRAERRDRSETSHRRHEASDVARAARLNVDFIKMDFLFGDDEDADLGSNNVAPTIDPFFDIPRGQPNRAVRKGRLELGQARPGGGPADVPGSDPRRRHGGSRLFQPRSPTGRPRPDIARTWRTSAPAARGNGRDVAVQEPRAGGSRRRRRHRRRCGSRPARSPPTRRASSTGAVTAGASGELVRRPPRWCGRSSGAGSSSAGPVNGFQNSQLHAGDGDRAGLDQRPRLRPRRQLAGTATAPPTITSVVVDARERPPKARRSS